MCTKLHFQQRMQWSKTHPQFQKGLRVRSTKPNHLLAQINPGRRKHAQLLLDTPTHTHTHTPLICNEIYAKIEFMTHKHVPN